MSGALLDTNLLVYAYFTGPEDPRSAKAKAAVSSQVLLGSGIVSVQNLAELTSVCLTELKPEPPLGIVRDVLFRLSSVFAVVVPRSSTVALALNGVEKHAFSFWDAMLWAVAAENGIDEILTEDFQHGRVVEGVRFTDPMR